MNYEILITNTSNLILNNRLACDLAPYLPLLGDIPDALRQLRQWRLPEFVQLVDE